MHERNFTSFCLVNVGIYSYTNIRTDCKNEDDAAEMSPRTSKSISNKNKEMMVMLLTILERLSGRSAAAAHHACGWL